MGRLLTRRPVARRATRSALRFQRRRFAIQATAPGYFPCREASPKPFRACNSMRRQATGFPAAISACRWEAERDDRPDSVSRRIFLLRPKRIAVRRNYRATIRHVAHILSCLYTIVRFSRPFLIRNKSVWQPGIRKIQQEIRKNFLNGTRSWKFSIG